MNLKVMWDNIHLRLINLGLRREIQKKNIELDKIHYSYDEEMVKLAKYYEKKNKTLYKRCETLAEDNRRLGCLLRKFEKGNRNVTKGTGQKVARKEQNNK